MCNITVQNLFIMRNGAYEAILELSYSYYIFRNSPLSMLKCFKKHTHCLWGFCSPLILHCCLISETPVWYNPVKLLRHQRSLSFWMKSQPLLFLAPLFACVLLAISPLSLMEKSSVCVHKAGRDMHHCITQGTSPVKSASQGSLLYYIWICPCASSMCTTFLISSF